MTVPYTFGTATTSIPLSNLDANFNTPITLGNTSIYLGNTTTTIGNLTLTNATISSGNVTISNITVTTANVTTANVATLSVTGTANIATGNVTTLTSTSITDSGLTSGRVTFAGASGLLSDSAGLTFDGTNLTTTGTATATRFIPSGSTVATNGMYLPAANTLGFSTNSTERMRIDSSGNVLVGTTSAVDSSKVQISGAKVLSSGIPQGQLNILDSSAMAASVGGAIAFSAQYQSGLYTTMGSVEGIKENATAGQYGGSLVFRTRTNFGDNNERMRIDSSGNLLVGTTSTTVNPGIVVYGGINNAQIQIGHASGVASGEGYIGFQYNGSAIGSITQNGTTGVAYNTTSDYRLKENIVSMTGALAKVAQLKPVTYKWKTDGSNGQGFIAHELQAVVPDCVTGEKDAVDKDGKPAYQGVDTSFLVATLTAAIQEQQALIESLTTRLTALESK